MMQPTARPTADAIAKARAGEAIMTATIQPIATAPKDRRVLLYIRHYGWSVGTWNYRDQI